jgi:hypothetical protein
LPEGVYDLYPPIGCRSHALGLTEGKILIIVRLITIIWREGKRERERKREGGREGERECTIV